MFSLSYIRRIARLLEVLTVSVIAYVAVFDCAQSAKSLVRLTKQSCLRGENLEIVHRVDKAWVEDSVVALESQHNICANVRRRKRDEFELI